ncbi:hypothetical protein AVEN_87841-1 [Araneus ventricosus]|uniref:Uncharacterized protein n=1 Tax=Araneus ventricosus TaxID=182803 RepID=A0A4Y2BB17_ARAVE|nr:hypothetical protein AVEN_87841-1 [Araneus ventricosus]
MSVSICTAVFCVLMLLGYEQVHGYSLAASECRSPSDCGPGECCVLERERRMDALHFNCLGKGKPITWLLKEGRLLAEYGAPELGEYLVFYGPKWMS